MKLIDDDMVDAVALTGSNRAGEEIAAHAGARIKKVVLELGGSDPFILLSTHDLDATVQNAVDARLNNSGQACDAAKRFIIADELYEPFLEKFRAKIAEIQATDPTSADSALGPLSSLRAAEGLDEQVKRAIDHGATLVHGGTRDGAAVAPTVVADPPPDAEIVTHEVFGALVSVLPFEDFHDALATCNSSRYGLQAGLFTRDIGRILTAWRELDVGGLVVNGSSNFRLDHVPFGGVKDSGFGRESPRCATRSFCTALWS